MNTELVTLAADLPVAPVWLARVAPGGWNGFHVPVGTADEFVAYMAACRDADAGHADEWPTPFVDAAGILRLPAVDAPDDRDHDTTWAPREDGRYALDGLVWTTAADPLPCPACAGPTVPPTPGTDEVGHYCEPCGTAYDVAPIVDAMARRAVSRVR